MKKTLWLCIPIKSGLLIALFALSIFCIHAQQTTPESLCAYAPVCSGDAVTITNQNGAILDVKAPCSSNGVWFCYKWGDGAYTCSTAGVASHTYSTSATYTIGVWVQSARTCGGACGECPVSSAGQSFWNKGPATVTATVTVPTAIRELNNPSNIFVFPNPSGGVFTIQLATGRWQLASSQKSEASIFIYNVMGEKVYGMDNVKWIMANPSADGSTIPSTLDQPLTIDLSSQPDGIYFLKVQSGKEPACADASVGRSFTQKLIINH